MECSGARSVKAPDLLGPGEVLGLGLMSGTSGDGVDAALLSISGEDTIESVRLRQIAACTLPYPGDFRAGLFRLQEGPLSARDILRSHALLGEALADAAGACLALARPEEQARLAFVASHGHTLWHEPHPPGEFRREAGTMQLGEAARIAARLGVPVVSDFRQQDVALGGQGAPLIPLLDYVLLRSPEECRASQNIGGIGNVTYLPAGGGLHETLAFDTGPGNCLIDAAAEIASAGRLRCDLDGALAASSPPHAGWVEHVLALPYFQTPPPRSTGRELFSRTLVREMFDAGLPPESVVSTLTEVTVQSILRSYRAWLGPVDRVIVSGGGARNPELMRRLRTGLHPIPVSDFGVAGIDAGSKEAAGFALLGYCTLRGWPGSLPSATGARAPAVLGQITWAS